MTCCEEKFIVWNLKGTHVSPPWCASCHRVVVLGEILASVTTHMRPNSFAAVSPCGRFVICTGEITELVLAQ